MFKVNNKDTRTSASLIKTPERQHRFDVFIVNLENISHLVEVLLLLSISR